jgi:hemerythrin-like domain-containing protein
MIKETGADIEAIPSELLRTPLEWFFAEHYRQRQLCLLIDDLSRRTVFDGERIDAIAAFIRQDLPVHIIDEEEDLFPLLRRRCLPEDELERVLAILSADHKADLSTAAQVLAILDAARAQRRAPGLDRDARAALAGFAAQERQHLALENAVVLPIARLRLTDADLHGLAARLAARRGQELDGPPPHASA